MNSHSTVEIFQRQIEKTEQRSQEMEHHIEQAVQLVSFLDEQVKSNGKVIATLKKQIEAENACK